MAELRGRAAAAWVGALLLAGMLIAGCANESKRTELQLVQLLQALPGSYDNRGQVAEDAHAARAPHEAWVLEIVAVDSLLLGEHAFYEQRTSDDDAHRIAEQRLLSFSVIDGHIFQAVWSLTDPRRWRAGHVHPELFTSLQQPDVKLMVGCGLAWKEQDGKFTGANEREKCRAPSPEGGSSVFVETRAELDHDELALSERGFDARGKLAYGRDDEPFTRFRRRAPAVVP